jgi:hypothetical protein
MEDNKFNFDFKWDVFKHIDSIREGRTNFFLIAEAMMVAGYMALSSTEYFLRITVGILGLIYTASWFFVNLRQSNRLDHLAKNNLLYNEFLLEVVKAGKGIPGILIMNYVLPLSTTAFWIILLIKAWIGFPGSAEVLPQTNISIQTLHEILRSHVLFFNS